MSAAYKGPYTGGAAAGGIGRDPGHRWERTPWYSPARWFGYSWRKWVGGVADGYDYQSHKQRAQQILRERFDVSEQSQQNWGASADRAASYIAGRPTAIGNHGAGRRPRS